jgi:hypothetical protein
MVWKHFTVAAVIAAAHLLPLTAQAIVRAGDPAPDFSLLDTNGVTHTLSGYRGKVVLLGLIGST